MMSNIGKNSTPGIEYIDGNINKKLGKSQRKLILNIESTIKNPLIFISIDFNYHNTAYKLKYKLKHEKQANLTASKLGPFLKKEYGSDILKIFNPDY